VGLKEEMDKLQQEEEKMEVKVIIDDREIKLEPNGESKNFLKFKNPDKETDVIANVYVKKPLTL